MFATLADGALRRLCRSAGVVAIGCGLVGACTDYGPNGRLLRAGTPVEAGVVSTSPPVPTDPPWVPPPVDRKCAYLRLRAADLFVASAASAAPARFTRFFEGGVVAELASGAEALVHVNITTSGFLETQVQTLPADAVGWHVRTTLEGYVLACSAEHCALLDPDPGRPGELRWTRGATLPWAGSWGQLALDGNNVCVGSAGGEWVCFDGAGWVLLDGGGVVARDAAAGPPALDATSGDAGTGGDATSSADGAAGSVAPPSGEAGAEVGPSASPDGAPRDASASDAALAAATAAPRPCQEPSYRCSNAALLAEPLCYYALINSGTSVVGVTRSGQIVYQSGFASDGSLACGTISQPFGEALDMLDLGCGVVALLTADAVFTNCDGCPSDVPVP